MPFQLESHRGTSGQPEGTSSKKIDRSYALDAEAVKLLDVLRLDALRSPTRSLGFVFPNGAASLTVEKDGGTVLEMHEGNFALTHKVDRANRGISYGFRSSGVGFEVLQDVPTLSGTILRQLDAEAFDRYARGTAMKSAELLLLGYEAKELSDIRLQHGTFTISIARRDEREGELTVTLRRGSEKAERFNLTESKLWKIDSNGERIEASRAELRRTSNTLHAAATQLVERILKENP